VIVQPHHSSAALETRIDVGHLVIDNLSTWFDRRTLITAVA
jgi:lactate dehydrogenase-like 2-hydroxyacid dehydrogenase